MYILAVTTYNRLSFLKNLLDSFCENINSEWQLIIADDGSTDGTLEYLGKLHIPKVSVTIIKNNRKGIHYQFNTIIKELENIDFDYCFKCDDDIEFIRPGWEDIYINAIQESGYHHLCHFDTSWRPEKNLIPPVKKDPLISHCEGKDVQGSFFTLTPKVIKKVGYMDVENFGFRGVGHIDYTLRACRAGFNDINHPFDVQVSNEYITHQNADYKSAMNLHIQNALEDDTDTQRKYELIKDQSRIYVGYNENNKVLNTELERDLLLKRLDTLENEKRWYEATYGHQPRWFIRLGKALYFIRNLFKN
ncbi:glycosyltransferase family 2 protein [Fulvivirga lutea]|uniref:Glycosyltransferase n=1 Tax=Fulvivirga lutea TaxID=2810512 RepID=A0A974WI96_9BACT|nr:glycosyltransferase [Fulvivirga lutea]QSE98404.1 glycosyltransferase [Fulvivirga lutea]